MFRFLDSGNLKSDGSKTNENAALLAEAGKVGDKTRDPRPSFYNLVVFFTAMIIVLSIVSILQFLFNWKCEQYPSEICDFLNRPIN